MDISLIVFAILPTIALIVSFIALLSAKKAKDMQRKDNELALEVQGHASFIATLSEQITRLAAMSQQNNENLLELLKRAFAQINQLSLAQLANLSSEMSPETRAQIEELLGVLGAKGEKLQVTKCPTGDPGEPGEKGEPEVKLPSQTPFPPDVDNSTEDIVMKLGDIIPPIK